MRLALAQINSYLGDFAGNADKILDFTNRAKEKKADLVVFSELCLFGYPTGDLLERSYLIAEQETQLKRVIKSLPKGITAIFGAVIKNPSYGKTGGKPFFNVAVVACRGSKPQYFSKQLLPSYDVFDDTRFFQSGSKTGIVNIKNVGKVAITVCEDMWAVFTKRYSRDPLASVKHVDLIVNISASPFSPIKEERRFKAAALHAKRIKAPFLYVNQVGAQDEIIFDGRSFVIDEKAKLIVQASPFEEDLVIMDLEKKRAEYRPIEQSPMELFRQALVSGIRDFMKKTGQKRVHLGLSGGIDSALVACLAVDALGPANVQGILLPGPYNSKKSVTDSLALASNLKIKTQNISINNYFKEAKATLDIFDKTASSPAEKSTRELAEQNVQARIRGLILMSFSNLHRSMLLSTSNKSELASGYSTLYGDSCGGLAPIGDLTKTEIYELAKHYNFSREIIPKNILNKPPSAELAPGQLDQDSLPPYKELDKAVNNLVTGQKAAVNPTEKWLEQKLYVSEFKRWQSPPILRVSEHAFGRGRRMPIARKF